MNIPYLQYGALGVVALMVILQAKRQKWLDKRMLDMIGQHNSKLLEVAEKSAAAAGRSAEATQRQAESNYRIAEVLSWCETNRERRRSNGNGKTSATGLIAESQAPR